MQELALLLGQVVGLVILDEIDHRALGQLGGLVENESAVLDARADGSHAGSVGRTLGTGNLSGV